MMSHSVFCDGSKREILSQSFGQLGCSRVLVLFATGWIGLPGIVWNWFPWWWMAVTNHFSTLFGISNWWNQNHTGQNYRTSNWIIKRNKFIRLYNFCLVIFSFFCVFFLQILSINIFIYVCFFLIRRRLLLKMETVECNFPLLCKPDWLTVHANFHVLEEGKKRPFFHVHV